jgi:hypothetical protein
LHPEIARRDCNHCQVYQYNEQTGRVEIWRGEPLPRLQGQPSPCRTARGCPRGTPEDDRRLTQRNAVAYEHYLQCRATGNFPDDAIVARNAARIQYMEDELQRRRSEEVCELLSLLLDERSC